MTTFYLKNVKVVFPSMYSYEYKIKYTNFF